MNVFFGLLRDPRQRINQINNIHALLDVGFFFYVIFAQAGLGKNYIKEKSNRLTRLDFVEVPSGFEPL